MHLILISSILCIGKTFSSAWTGASVKLLNGFISLGYERVGVDPALLQHLLVYLFDFVFPLMMLPLCGEQQPLYISSYDASNLFSDLQQRSWAHCLKRRISEWNPHVLGSSPSSLCDWSSVPCSSTTPSMSTPNSTARWVTRLLLSHTGVPGRDRPGALLLCCDLCKLQLDSVVAIRHWQWLSRNEQV